MARAVRRALAAAGIAVLAMTVSAANGAASVAPGLVYPAVASVLPYNGQKVGVAHPVIVTFSRPVADRAAAERSIVVTTGQTASATVSL